MRPTFPSGSGLDYQCLRSCRPVRSSTGVQSSVQSGGDRLVHDGTFNLESWTYLRFDGCPRLVRIKLGHGLGNRRSIFSQVFLINDAVMVDDEGHDPGGTVLRRISHYAETAHHLTFH